MIEITSLNENSSTQKKGTTVIKLTFIIDHADIEHAEKFMERVQSRRDLWSLQAYVPLGEVVFSIDDKNMSWCPLENRKEEILDFAVFLSHIVHTIKLGETLTQYRMMEGGTRYFTLIDEDTLKIETDSDEDAVGVCRFSDFKVKAESFCAQLHSEILRLFPIYFELMDQVSISKINEDGETVSQKVLKLLLRH